MFEDDEFARSMRPAVGVQSRNTDRGSRMFTPDDPDMMNSIFRFLENDTETKTTVPMAKKWTPPHLTFEPDYQRYAEYNESSGQESSPSPTVSLFSESSGDNGSEVSGLTTPRTMSNGSSRAPSRLDQMDELRMTMKPGNQSNVIDKSRLTPSPPPALLPRTTYQTAKPQNEVVQPYRAPSPIAPPKATAPIRRVELGGAPVQRVELSDSQEQRQSSQSNGHWPALSTVASKYERKWSKSYHLPSRNTMSPPAAPERREELDELQQSYQPSAPRNFSPATYSSQESPQPQEATRIAYNPAYFKTSEPARTQGPRFSQEVSPSPYKSMHSPEPPSARTYESRSSQSTVQGYRNTLQPVSETGVRNIEPKYTPETLQRPNRPQPPSIDPQLRRYDSFQMSGGSYELKDPQVFPEDERKKSLDNLVAVTPKQSIRSRFSFPRPGRASVTSVVDIMPRTPPSPAATPPGESIPPLSELRLPTPDFSRPPRPKRESAPEASRKPMEIIRKDASTGIEILVLDTASPASSASKSVQFRLSAPTLTLSIPESQRPVPQKMDQARPTLSETLLKFKEDSMLTRPRPKATTNISQQDEPVGEPVSRWQPPKAYTGKVPVQDESMLSRPRPKSKVKGEPIGLGGINDEFDSILSRPRPERTITAPVPEPAITPSYVPMPASTYIPPTAFAPSSIQPQTQTHTQQTTSTDSILSRPRPKPRRKEILSTSTLSTSTSSTTTNSSPISPPRETPPMIPAPNFSRGAHASNYDFTSLNPAELQHAVSNFEEQEPVRPAPLSLVHSHSSPSPATSNHSPAPPSYPTTTTTNPQQPPHPTRTIPSSLNIPTSKPPSSFFASSNSLTLQQRRQLAASTKAKSQAHFFHNNMNAPSTGLQITIARRVATFSKLEWVVESSSLSSCRSRNGEGERRGKDELREGRGVRGEGALRCFTQTNTLGRRTDFFVGLPKGSSCSSSTSSSRSSSEHEEGYEAGVGEHLFSFARKSGSLRVGELVSGGSEREELFRVRDLGCGMSPYWVVEFGNQTEEKKPGEAEKKQWTARGNESLSKVDVACDGEAVGRIVCVKGRGGHCYTIDISADMNYAVMTALVTVFDDWRMDHAC